MKKILIVEDDVSIAEIERDFLEISGYDATIVTDGGHGLEEAESGDYDLILLDVMLPDMDGFEICRRIRGRIDIPILMVTAKTEDIDKIRGLGIGADDYISKPFSPTELVARVKANLAQYERLKPCLRPDPANSPTGNPAAGNLAKDELRLGNIAINPRSRRVHVDGREIECKAREFDLLLFLMTNPETVFGKEALYERIWGAAVYGDVKTVAVHINRLREKIEKDPSSPAHIQTVWGAGYRFKI
ncbi:MAG: response regulator transcription factor [Acidobacteriota bacterium]|jgi:DNA-binding response OmpR family regulator|nr:response regulator transcription factor [Acidobacteriota bacterium]